MRKVRMTPLGATTFAIRVDSYVKGEMKGVVDSVLLPAPTPFESLPQLILMLDELMDEEELVASETPRDSSFMPTLELEVLFRQHHSWQGCIRWLDGEREAAFRSVLELIVALEMMLGE